MSINEDTPRRGRGFGGGRKHLPQNKNMREALIELFQRGVPARKAARMLGVTEGSARSVHYQWSKTMRGVDEAPVEPEINAVRRRDEERALYAHHYDDIHVRLLGDPPLHRSALWGRHQ